MQGSSGLAVSDEILSAGGNYLQKNGEESLTEKKLLNFLFIGRLVYYKGCSVLVDAFARMKTDATLTIIGDGVLKEELMRQAETQGIASRVSFLGYVSDEKKQICMEAADVFVLPSVERSEAFGLVQLEAMAYGIPVINTNLPSGVPEVSIHGETGLTVRPGEVKELSEAMNWMCTHPEERKNMGRAARKRVEERYTQDILVRNIKHIYEELCE